MTCENTGPGPAPLRTGAAPCGDGNRGPATGTMTAG
ncbi:hypothetical protein GA0115255_126573, partial [Streptomyces sp. Ncost-T6T-2b]